MFAYIRFSWPGNFSYLHHISSYFFWTFWFFCIAFHVWILFFWSFCLFFVCKLFWTLCLFASQLAISFFSSADILNRAVPENMTFWAKQRCFPESIFQFRFHIRTLTFWARQCLEIWRFEQCKDRFPCNQVFIFGKMNFYILTFWAIWKSDVFSKAGRSTSKSQLRHRIQGLEIWRVLT